MSPEREKEIRYSMDQLAIRLEDGREVLTIAGPNGIAGLGRDIRDLLAALDEARKDAARFIDDGLAIGADVDG